MSEHSPDWALIERAARIIVEQDGRAAIAAQLAGQYASLRNERRDTRDYHPMTNIPVGEPMCPFISPPPRFT